MGRCCGRIRPTLAGSPFSDWRVPGVLLAGLVGGGFLLAGWWQWRGHRHARELSMAAGAGLVCFEAAELAWLEFQPLEAVFAAVGVIVIGLAWHMPTTAAMTRLSGSAMAAGCRSREEPGFRPHAVGPLCSGHHPGWASSLDHGRSVYRLGGRAVRKAAGAGLGGAVALGVYLRWVRPRAFSWGATGEEASLPMAGDELCPRPQLNATRAVTIAAGPEDIWPWLVQWGWNRAGFYSYDLLDNLGRPSAAADPPAVPAPCRR